MDNSAPTPAPDPGPEQRAPVLTFSPNPVLAGAFVVVFVVFAALLFTTSDRQGRVLYGLVCVVLAAVCATDLLWRPRLRIDGHGVAVRSPTLTGRFGWDEIERFAVDERVRLGVTVRALEIDAGPRLVVLGQRSLGADPREVVRLAGAVRPPR